MLMSVNVDISKCDINKYYQFIFPFLHHLVIVLCCKNMTNKSVSEST
jgi:hypothetical protein